MLRKVYVADISVASANGFSLGVLSVALAACTAVADPPVDRKGRFDIHIAG